VGHGFLPKIKDDKRRTLRGLLCNLIQVLPISSPRSSIGSITVESFCSSYLVGSLSSRAAPIRRTFYRICLLTPFQGFFPSNEKFLYGIVPLSPPLIGFFSPPGVPHAFRPVVPETPHKLEALPPPHLRQEWISFSSFPWFFPWSSLHFFKCSEHHLGPYILGSLSNLLSSRREDQAFFFLPLPVLALRRPPLVCSGKTHSPIRKKEKGNLSKEEICFF